MLSLLVGYFTYYLHTGYGRDNASVWLEAIAFRDLRNIHLMLSKLLLAAYYWQPPATLVDR